MKRLYLAVYSRNVCTSTAVKFPKRFTFENQNNSNETQTINENFDEQPVHSDYRNIEIAYHESSNSQRVSKDDEQSTERKTMMTPRLSQNLTKAGYGLVGNHSAVKICRWTKKQLQGRGGCYKHTFYGIESHRCMETTTFLACANRCVFCWRHHTHPVAKDFSRWLPDPPKDILEKALTTHKSLIKPLKGLEGATADRYKEALNPVHCALSLVGEPIVYPYINEFVSLLHSKKISSFIVTNGQHPDAIANLTTPVTQLYVSVDAPDPETLKKIGRPLFKDYWERLQESLSLLRQRTERTVARLTIVKHWNDNDIEGYAKLIKHAQPDFIEVKAFTYPGPTTSIKQSGLSIHNCPTGNVVVAFGKRLVEALKSSNSDSKSRQYDVASIHLHSNSLLVSATDYRSTPDVHGGNQNWNTWIDYNRFHQLMEECEMNCATPLVVDDNISIPTYPDNGSSKSCRPFSSRLASLYLHPSPEWTLPTSPLNGFDPEFDSLRWMKQLKNRQHHEALSEANQNVQ